MRNFLFRFDEMKPLSNTNWRPMMRTRLEKYHRNHKCPTATYAVVLEKVNFSCWAWKYHLINHQKVSRHCNPCKRNPLLEWVLSRVEVYAEIWCTLCYCFRNCSWHTFRNSYTEPHRPFLLINSSLLLHHGYFHWTQIEWYWEEQILLLDTQTNAVAIVKCSKYLPL